MCASIHQSKAAFTLAEVLLTLGIIGIVTAMTLPTIIQNYQEKALVNQLKVAYSIFSQAHLQAVNDNGPIEYWDIGNSGSSGGAQKLFDMYKPYLKLAKECSTGSGCYYSGTYKALFNNVWGTQPNTNSSYAKGKLTNGMAFHLYSGGTNSCLNSSYCGTLCVDINGDKNPNQGGVDYFCFFITPKRVLPANATGTSSNNICKYNDTSRKNGAHCTYWVLTRENMDYRRRDISDEWDGSVP